VSTDKRPNISSSSNMTTTHFTVTLQQCVLIFENIYLNNDSESVKYESRCLRFLTEKTKV